ncbi:MAG: GAF domain-containing protein [Anaerolineae bacterium]|nr:GAF domain-containing protein [Anaerolineae bacterium]
MYYTLSMIGWNQLTVSRTIGLILVLMLAACGTGNTLPAPPEADSAPTSLPPAPSRVSSASIPDVCNCILRFDHIGIEQGLSQSSVRIIFQDSIGFLWFGTEDGLNRYDGYSFKTYKPDPDSSNSLSDRWITSIVEDRDGYLWIGTRHGGLNRYDPRSESFTQFRNIDSDPTSLVDDHVNVLYLDRDDNLWVGTPKGLDLYDRTGAHFTHFSYNPTKPESLTGKNITVIYQDSRGRYWIGTTAGGLNRFDPQSRTFVPYQHNPDDENSISNDYVTAIAESLNSTLWIGTRGGLNRFEPETGKFQRFTHSNVDKQTISSDMVTSLLIDGTGNLWVGTTEGLDRWIPIGSRFIHYYNDPSFSQSLSNNYILSILEDRGGVLWFGTYGGGVNKYDRQRDRFAYYRHIPDNPNTLSGNFIYSIYVDSDGYAWIGTFGSGLNRFTPSTQQVIHYKHNEEKTNTLISDVVYSLDEDQDGFLWIGTWNGLDRMDRQTGRITHFQRDSSKPESLSANAVYEVFVDSRNNVWVGTASGLDLFDRDTRTFKHYSPQVGNPNSLSGSVVDVIREDSDGNLWIGTADSGLNRFDPETETFTQYRSNPKDTLSLSNDTVLSIHQDQKGRLWVGTFGGGLNLYDPKTETFTYLLEKDGLPNGVVYGILEDDQGYLWLSTNYGISRFDPETRTFRNFDANDGLQSNEFNSGAFAKGRNGELYFGGINGLTVFHPSAIVENSYLPQVTLTSITEDDTPVVTDRSVETAKQVVLKWPQNSIEFEFAALSYNQPNKNRYAYILEDFDTNWHYIGTKRDGRYTNLPGGEYTLLLKAANSDGVWNETPLRIAVTVIPPFWQTLWFRILLGVVAVAAVAVGIRVRTRSVQERNRELERLVRERTSALEKRNQEIQALYQADERILRNVSLNQVFQTLVDVAVDTLNADRSVVFAWDDKQTKVLPRISRGFKPETLKVLEFAKGEGVIGRVLETGEAAIVRQIELDDFRPDIREALIAEGIRSFVHLPVIVDHRIVGVFNVGFTKPNLIGDDTTRLFSALTNRASISIANMELFEQTKDLAVMEERNRLARDLHDSAKQKAFAALAQLGTVRGILNGNGNSATMHLNEAENLVSDVIQELTFLVQEIYPIALQEKGLATVLKEYTFEWENRNEIAVNLSMHNDKRLPLGIEQAIYRVTQESLANVARHSRAKRVDISLMYNGDSVQLSLSDDGCGFDVDKKGRGLGLRSIRERVSSVHGTVQIQSAPGQGTRILVQVPTKG